MIAYRPHRGSLADAMKEAKTFLNEWQMKRYVANNWNLAIGRKVLDPEDIIIDSESTDDDRVGWKNVHMVCAARIGNEDYMKKYGNPQCIGYCAYDVSNAPKSSPWICAKKCLIQPSILFHYFSNIGMMQIIHKLLCFIASQNYIFIHIMHKLPSFVSLSTIIKQTGHFRPSREISFSIP